MRIIIGCEESQTICLAFRAAGHEAYSCDLKPCSGGKPEWHFQGDIFHYLKADWDMAILHPPCTFLGVTGNKWLKDQPARKSGKLVGEARREARREAVSFVMDLINASSHIPKTCVENPVGILSTVWRKPDQIIQPMQFGHVEPKKTCLWLKGLPLLKATHSGIVGEYHITKSGKRIPKWFFYAGTVKKLDERSTIRSKTFPGIAEAMVKQWGSLPTHIPNPTLF